MPLSPLDRCAMFLYFAQCVTVPKDLALLRSSLYSPDPVLLKGRVALVTGSGRGIGRAIARLFASEGASVFLTARTHAELASTAAEINKSGAAAFATADLTKEADCARVVSAAREKFGPVDILVATPFAASPTTLQPRRASRRGRVPHRINPWSSAIRMRFFSCSISCERYRHAYGCAVTAEMNIKLPTDQFHPLLHAGDADANLERRPLFPLRRTGRDTLAKVADFQGEMRVAIDSYLGLLTSRMALDVGEGLLHHSK